MRSTLTKNAIELAAHSEDLLKSSGLRSRIPGVEVNTPWSASSLRSIEVTLLSTTEYNINDYAAFIGKGLVERFNGRWVDIKDHINDPGNRVEVVGVSYPNMEHTDILNSVVNIALLENSGEYWISLFKSNEILLNKYEN